jgi:hypothetical protein
VKIVAYALLTIFSGGIGLLFHNCKVDFFFFENIMDLYVLHLIDSIDINIEFKE